MDALGDPAFRAALTSPAFNRLPYLAELRRTIRMILGPQAFSYPARCCAPMYPERPPGVARGRYVHQDYAVSGVQDMLTTWVPLTDIPVRLGGLAVRPGSHLGPPQRPHVLGPRERGWATADYRAGDALVFHCLTSHAALPNREESLRLSGDFRWQCPDQPAPGPARDSARASQRELFSRMFARKPWWEPVPGRAAADPARAAGRDLAGAVALLRRAPRLAELAARPPARCIRPAGGRSPRAHQPSSASRSSPMPKWWATSWITVRRTCSTTCSSVAQIAQIARR